MLDASKSIEELKLEIQGIAAEVIEQVKSQPILSL